MKTFLAATLVLSTMAITTTEATAGRRAVIRQQHRAVHQALRSNRQVRRDISRTANRHLPNYQHRDINRVLRNHAAADRQFHRNYHRSIRSIPRYGYGGYRYGSGVTLSRRGIGYTSPGFSIFLGR